MTSAILPSWWQAAFAACSFLGALVGSVIFGLNKVSGRLTGLE